MSFRTQQFIFLASSLFFCGLSYFCGSSTWAFIQSPHLVKVREALSMQPEADELKKLIPLVQKNDIRTVEFLVYQLPRHLNPAIRGHIARILKHVGNAPETNQKPKAVIKALVAALDDATLYRDPTERIECGEGVINAPWSVQMEAAKSLGVLQVADAEVIEKLTSIAKLTEPDRIRARLAAIVSLGQIGSAADDAAAAVAAVLKSQEPQPIRLRQAAIKTLGQLGPGAAAELPLLVKLLDAPNHDDHASVIYAISGLREAAQTIVPRFIEKVNSSKNSGHYAEALSRMGDVVHPFVMEDIKSADPARRDRALSVLWRIGKEAVFALDEIKKQLSDDEVQIRQKAIGTILKMEALAEPALPELEHAISDHNEQIRDSAMFGLLMISSKHPLALRRMELLAESPQKLPMVAYAAQLAGPDARFLLPSIEAALENADEKNKPYAAKALLFIDGSSMLGFETIRKSLMHPSRDVRRHAFQTCKALGEKAEPMLDELRKLEAKNPFEQTLLQETIATIEIAIRKTH